MEIKPDTIEAVIREPLTKHDNGRAKYGPLASIRTDGIFSKRQRPSLDCINYCVFQILRLRQISGTVRAQTGK